jgi:DNA-binding MarR family transcriptional regulator
MLQLQDLPDENILRKFAARYPDAEIESVLQFLNILRIGSDLSEMLDAFLGKYSLLQGRWWVLILLMREENLSSTPSRLAEKSGVSRPTMTKLLSGLERDGLVARVKDDHDLRQCSIKLTPAGQTKLDDVMPDYYRRVKMLMACIPSEQRQEIISRLEIIRKNKHTFD